MYCWLLKWPGQIHSTPYHPHGSTIDRYNKYSTTYLSGPSPFTTFLLSTLTTPHHSRAPLYSLQLLLDLSHDSLSLSRTSTSSDCSRDPLSLANLLTPRLLAPRTYSTPRSSSVPFPLYSVSSPLLSTHLCSGRVVQQGEHLHVLDLQVDVSVACLSLVVAQRAGAGGPQQQQQ